MGLFSKRKSKQERLEEAKKKRNIYESRRAAGEMDTGYTKSRMNFAGGTTESRTRTRSVGGRSGASAQQKKNQSGLASSQRGGSGGALSKKSNVGFAGGSKKGSSGSGSSSTSSKSSSGFSKPVGF